MQALLPHGIPEDGVCKPTVSQINRCVSSGSFSRKDGSDYLRFTFHLSLMLHLIPKTSSSSSDSDVAASTPDLWRLLAIPSPANHIISRRHSRHFDLVNDGHVGVLVAAALAVHQRFIRAGPRAVRERCMRVIPAFVTRVCEPDVTRLIPPAVLVTTWWRLELRREVVPTRDA